MEPNEFIFGLVFLTFALIGMILIASSQDHENNGYN